MREIAPKISVDPGVRFGKPVIKGTRVPVEILVAKLAGGMSSQDVGEAYGVSKDDVLAALAYAANSISSERIFTS